MNFEHPPEGHTRQKPFTHIGDIVEEICPPKSGGTGNAKGGAIYQDERKTRVVAAEPRIKLFLEHRVNAVATTNKRIVSVTAQNIRTARRVTFSGKMFADCTGDATVGFLSRCDQTRTAGIQTRTVCDQRRTGWIGAHWPQPERSGG